MPGSLGPGLAGEKFKKTGGAARRFYIISPGTPKQLKSKPFLVYALKLHVSRLNAILLSNFRRQNGGYLTESLEMAFVESDDVGDSVNNHHSRYHRVVNLNAFDRVSRDKAPPLLMCS
jgi:hypothetical protein